MNTKFTEVNQAVSELREASEHFRHIAQKAITEILTENPKAGYFNEVNDETDANLDFMRIYDGTVISVYLDDEDTIIIDTEYETFSIEFLNNDEIIQLVELLKETSAALAE